MNRPQVGIGVIICKKHLVLLSKRLGNHLPGVFTSQLVNRVEVIE